MKTRGIRRFQNLPAAKSAAIQLGSDLAMMVDCWPSLPEHIKPAVLALIKCQTSG